MSFDISRFDRGYFDVEQAVLPVSTMVISPDIYDLLAGNTAGTVEFFADVKYGDAQTAIPYVDMISVEREMNQLAGTLHVGFMASVFPVVGLSQGDIITVTAGMRYNGKTAYQKIFHGRIKKITYPSAGTSVRAYLDAFDAGKDMIDEAPGVGQNTGPDAVNLPPRISGDVFTWMTTRLATLAMADVSLRPRSANITVPDNTMVAFRTLAEAFKAMTNAYSFRYLYMSGNNDLIVLDPAQLADEAPLFTLASAGIVKKQQIDSLIDRVNRIPYQKAGNTDLASVFWVDGDGVLHQTAASAVDAITGTYNDATDQASFPVLAADTLRNDIVTTTAEFEALAAQIADETQRERLDMSVRFNPFIDLGDVLSMDSEKWFISRIRHEIGLEPWSTKIEVRKL